MASSPSVKKTICSAALILITLPVYLPIWKCAFVDFDDREYVTENAVVCSPPTADNLIRLITEPVSGLWHPLTMLSHKLDFLLFGVQPAGHHVTNIILHLINVLLVFRVLTGFTGSIGRSFAVALLFAVHPVNTDAVAWIAQRKALLSGLFAWLALAAYGHYVRQPGGRRYTVMALTYVAGLLSKPVVIMLPLVFWLVDYWPLNRFANEGGGWISRGVKSLRDKIPLLIIGALFGLITFYYQAQAGALTSTGTFPLLHRLSQVPGNYLFYLGKLIWPSGLAVHYLRVEGAVAVGEWTLALCVLVILSLAIALWAKKSMYLPAGWSWFLLMLFPVIGLFSTGNAVRGDRFLYLPEIGFFIMVVWGVADLFSRGAWRVVPIAACAIVVVALSTVTWMQLGYWSDSLKLFSRALAVNPADHVMQDALGRSLIERGQVDEGLAHLEQARQLAPGEAAYHNNVGSTFMLMGRLDEAAACFQSALAADARYARAYQNLGRIFFRKGRPDQATENYENALRLNPHLPAAHLELGIIRLRQMKYEEAREHFVEVLRLQPGNPMALNLFRQVETFLRQPSKPPVSVVMSNLWMRETSSQ